MELRELHYKTVYSQEVSPSKVGLFQTNHYLGAESHRGITLETQERALLDRSGWPVGEPLFVSGYASIRDSASLEAENVDRTEASALLEIGIEGSSIGHAVERWGITCLAAHGEWTCSTIAITLYDSYHWVKK